MLRQYEKEYILIEAKGTVRDVYAILGGIITSVSILTILGFKFSIPPIRWLVDYWHVIAHNLWLNLFAFYPYEISNSDSILLTYFSVMTAMFLRGCYSDYIPLKRFRLQTQKACARLILLTIICSFLTTKSYDVELASNMFILQGLSMWHFYASVLILLILLFTVFEIYLFIIKKTKIILLVSHKPYLIFIFFLLAILVVVWQDILANQLSLASTVGLDVFSELYEAQKMQRGIIVFITVLAGLFIFPFSFWYLRAFYAVFLSTIILVAVDIVWRSLTL